MMWPRAIAMAIVMAILSISVFADQNAKGGVITGYTGNGANGTVTLTIKNPYQSTANVSYTVSVYGGTAAGQQIQVQTTIPAGQSLRMRVVRCASEVRPPDAGLARQELRLRGRRAHRARRTGVAVRPITEPSSIDDVPA